MPKDNIITKNGKTVKLVTLVPKKRQYKKPVSRKLIKSESSEEELESINNASDDNSNNSDSTSAKTSNTASTSGTNKLKKLKNYNDATYDLHLTSSNLPETLLEDDPDNDISKKKKTINSKESSNNRTRLADTKRKASNPSAMYTDPEDVKEKLRFYKRIDSDKVIDLSLGTRVKYVEVLEDGTFKYKPGGVIMVNKAPVYLVLVENRKSWSVQLDKHVIFVEHFEMVRKHYELRIKKLNDRIDQIEKVNTNLHHENARLKKLLKVNDDDAKKTKNNKNL